MAKMKIGGDLTGVARCPHCGVANPTLSELWKSAGPLYGAEETSRPGRIWATYQCSTCGKVILAECEMSLVGAAPQHPTRPTWDIARLFPDAKTVDQAIPDSARIYLTQAHETLHAPDAAALMAASAVDAMLKQFGHTEGSLYSRIDAAVGAHLLTEGMGAWAHAVRLEANNVRHADGHRPHLTSAEAIQVVEFADALGDFLFVLSAKIQEGVQAANTAGR